MGKAAPNAALKEAPPTEATEWLNFGHPCRGDNRIVDADAGIVDVLMPGGERPRRKFALVGFSSATRHMAPMNDPDWAIVGMNQLARHLRHGFLDSEGKVALGPDEKPITALRHGDVWFEIHKDWNTAVVPGTDHAGWLRDCEIPCYMTDIVADIPSSVRYPIERLVEKFDIDYFTSTVSFMLAWAIDHIDHLVYERTKAMPRNGESVADVQKLIESVYAEYTVGVFGIDLIVNEEYTEQRPSAEFWLGQAMARNISLIIPKQSALLKQHYRYGYQMEPDGHIRPSDFNTRRDWLKQQHNTMSNKAVELYGRLAELKDLPPTQEACDKRIDELTNEHQAASAEAVQLQGAVTELDYWAEVRNLRERGGLIEI